MTQPPGPPSPAWNQGGAAPGQPPNWDAQGLPPVVPLPPGFPMRVGMHPPRAPGPIGVDRAAVAPAVRRPDPGSRTGALIAKLIAIPLLLVVVTLQQASIYMSAAPAAAAPVVAAPAPDDQGLFVARLMLKVVAAWPELVSAGEPLKSLDALWQDQMLAPSTADQREWHAAMRARIDQLRAALVAGEVAGPDEALSRLASLQDRLALDEAGLAALRDGPAGEGSPVAPDAQGSADATSAVIHDSSQVIRVLRADAELLERHYQAVSEALASATPATTAGEPGVGAPTPPEPPVPVDIGSPLDDATWDALEERHGWFAELARVVGKPESDPERSAMFANGGALLAIMAMALGLVAVLCVGSLAAGIWLIVMLALGRVRFWFVPPLVGGSVYLETVATFIVAFLGTQVLAAGLAQVPGLQGYMNEVAMGIQWLVLLVIFWPLLRGVGVRQWRRDLGLIAPRGVVREMVAGLIAYLAGLPLLVCGAVIGILLKQLQDYALGDYLPDTGGESPVLEMVSSGGLWQLVLLFALATVWAPVVEETVFRGCLFRHLRSRMGFLMAAPLSALVFGLMHQYEIVLLGPVLALGVIFAFLREWRGSLVGAITMHALHNGTVLAIVISLVRLSA